MSLMKCKWLWLTALISISFHAYSQQQAPEKHALSLRECMDYAEKNNALVKNALLDIQIQEQQNRSITSSAYPQINGSFNLQYNPAIAVQTIPDFISPAVYGVLVQEGIKD